MIADLKPYPEYRPAEGGWLGQIPSHWNVRRMKYVVRETDSRSTTGKEQLLRVSQYTGVTQRRREDGLDGHDTRADSLVGYKRVEPNDLVINIMLAWNGSMGVSQHSGIASPAYCVYRFRQDVHPWYFHNLLRSPVYKARIKASSTGVVESRLRLYSDDLGRIEAILPPPVEQAAIVQFLDWMNVRLERAIQAKRKVIALLNEQKQAIIHRAVTRCLDASVPLKPSGIPWLGEIPQHWEVRALKRVVATKITDGPHETPELLDDGIDFMSAESMVNGRLVFERRRGFISRDLHEQYCIKCRPQRDDVFMCKSGATTGKIAIVETDQEFSVWSPLALLRANKRVILPRFLFVSLQTRYVQQQVQERWSFGTQPNLAMGAMGQISIAVPSIPEQADALVRIEEQSAPLTTAISRLEREIELLREYRTRLVADVVTGKLDVREAAARLPEEAPADIAENDTNLSDESESADEEAAV